MTHRADVTPPAPDAVISIDALLHAGGTETHYRRAGCGPAVLLLFPGGAAGPPAARLFERLARRFRVIAPRPPAGVLAPGAADPIVLVEWLRDLVDGLGLARPGLVVCESLRDAALAFARSDPDRAGALVVVSRDASAPAFVVRAGAPEGTEASIGGMMDLLDARPAAARS